MLLLMLPLLLVDARVADPDVRAAIGHYDDLRFDEVIPPLERALKKRRLSPADRQAALAYLGRGYAIFRKPRKAHRAFVELLTLDPEFEIGADESPLIRVAFAEARAAVAARSPAVDPPPAEPEPEPERVEPSPGRTEPVNAPRRSVAAPEVVEEGWTSSPWFWVAVGVGVVVIGGTVALVTTREGTQVPDGTWGSFKLP